MALEGLDEALFAELFISRIVGFGDAVGVEGEGIAWVELTFSDFAIPILEDSQYGGGGIEALYGVVAVEEKSGEMAAIGVAQAAGSVVIFGEEERGERTVRRVVAEKLVHRT